jgi:uncharacterized protein (DUF1684 family)
MEPDGWLTLVGLFWLREGPNTFGSDPSNDFVYAGSDTPPLLGTFTLDRGTGDDPATVRFEVAPGVQVLSDQSEPVTFVAMLPREGGQPVVLEHGTVQWFVMRRGPDYALRVRDSQSPVRMEFEGIERFPTVTGWRLPARFVPHDPPDTIQIPNILGTVNATPSPGSVVFEVDGDRFELAMWKDSDDPANFFTAFADATNGEDTYGGGRFIWVDAPDEYGRTVIDFNKAYNPPCVFTDFATCPLPPPQNRLAIAIGAGERTYGKE